MFSNQRICFLVWLSTASVIINLNFARAEKYSPDGELLKYFTVEGACPKDEETWLKIRQPLAEYLSLDSFRIPNLPSPKPSPEDTLSRSIVNCWQELETLSKKSKMLSDCFKGFSETIDFIKKTSTPTVLVQALNEDQKAKLKSLPINLKDDALLELRVMRKEEELRDYMNKLNDKRIQEGKERYPFYFVDVVQPAKGMDNNKRRLIVYNKEKLPGGRATHQWISYDIGGLQVSIVSTVEANQNFPESSYFQDWNAYKESGGPPVVEMRDPKIKLVSEPMKFSIANMASSDCLSCHLSGGPIRIVPQTPLDERDHADFKWVDQSFDRGTSIAPELSPNGTSIKPGSKLPLTSLNLASIPEKVLIDQFTRYESHLSSSYNGEKIDHQRMLGALNCIKCHQGNDRPYIQPERDSILDIVILKHKTMPSSKNQLSPMERDLLSRIIQSGGRSYTNSLNSPSRPDIEHGFFYYSLMGSECRAEPRERSGSHLVESQ